MNGVGGAGPSTAVVDNLSPWSLRRTPTYGSEIPLVAGTTMLHLSFAATVCGTATISDADEDNHVPAVASLTLEALSAPDVHVIVTAEELDVNPVSSSLT